MNTFVSQIIGSIAIPICCFLLIQPAGAIPLIILIRQKNKRIII
ncbi:hypothetical protein BSM4216_1227 [Bacillus smithii]|nr:hypothetical protein BSM4216_1227 [Bacillus smithii]